MNDVKRLFELYVQYVGEDAHKSLVLETDGSGAIEDWFQGIYRSGSIEWATIEDGIAKLEQKIMEQEWLNSDK